MNAENTRYGYKNEDGHRLQISTVGAGLDHVEISVIGVGDLDWRSLNVPTAEVPGIALALLKAAGFGARGGHTAPNNWAESVETAVGQLDDAVHLAEKAAAREELTRRRDELAQKFAGDAAYAYRFAGPDHQAAIDMIIQLQDQAGAK